jgi:hypothetical protein
MQKAPAVGKHSQGLNYNPTKISPFPLNYNTMTTPASLIPTLPDVLTRRRQHAVTDLQPGDQLHLTAAILGFARGRVLPIYGYCVHTDEQGQPFLVRAYVRADEARGHAVPFHQRDARLHPTTGQRERWFGAVLMYMVEIDLTDYADCLRLERLSQRVLPLLVETEMSHCQAA